MVAAKQDIMLEVTWKGKKKSMDSKGKSGIGRSGVERDEGKH